ncbi:MAG TPA: CbiX/SirB N-terminal domain-containing protein, partial [Phototrophicaceae bacterium]|nr:CbiX/SirB N-terminal domain-containing protein [Phototrophicaceae bacterium]
GIMAGIRHCIASGAQRIIIVPYLLYEKQIYDRLVTQIQQIAASTSDIDIVIAPYLSDDTNMIEAVSQRYREAIRELTLNFPFAEDDERLKGLTHSHGKGNTHRHTVNSFPAMPSILPPRYQNGGEISAAPMGAADLVFDANGQVAWDQIWGDFCDLALAGGPPHRGTLLEPTVPEVVRANPERYQQVLTELERGIRLITRLPIVVSQSPGWIGIQCTDEAMALWLLRAIIVENVSVRREDTVLYLPASPDFRLEYEIKNVITVIAKTHHYWIEHLNDSVQR